MVLTTPSYWIAAARRAMFGCSRCYMTGQYKSPIASGICFRCEGKGFQNDTDVMRNRAYDAHAREKFNER